MRLIGNVATLFLGTVLARLLSSSALIVIARGVGPGALGQYTATMAALSLLSPFFTLGLDGWLLYEGGRDRSSIGELTGTALCLKVILGLLWVGGTGALAPRLNPSVFSIPLVVVGALSVWTEEIARLVWSSFKAQLRNDVTLVLMVLPWATFLGVALLLARQGTTRPEVYLGARLVGTTVGACVGLFWGASRLPLRVSLWQLGTTVRSAAPFAVSVALAMVYGRADLTIVASKLGREAAGVYGPAATLISAFFLLPDALFGVLVPMASRSWQEDPRQTRRAVPWLVGAMGLAGIVLGGALVIFASELVNLVYGARYQSSADVLSLLGIVLALRFVNVALAGILVSVGWQTTRMAVQSISAGLNVLMILAIIGRYGVMGVAGARVVGEAALFVGYLNGLVVWSRRQRREICHIRTS